MVNLEYYVTMDHNCVHDIPGSESVNSIVDFLDNRLWRTGTKICNEGFTCTSFLNEPAKQLVIVHRGTDPTNLSQLKADVRIALNRITSQIVSMADWHTLQSLLNNALKLDVKAGKFVRNDFSVTITGHSLGGWLAQLCTLLSKHPEFFPVGPRGDLYFQNDTSLNMNQPYDLHCVAFDSPGANAVLTRLKDDEAWLKGSPRDVEIALQDLDITVYLANKNLVNMCGTHTGTVKTIDVMSNASFFARLNPIASHSMEGIWAYFMKKS